MKLQSKVVAILACLWVVICLIIFIDSKMVLEKKYEALEYKLAIKDINRAQKALSGSLAKLELYTNSFASWDEGHNFMKNKNQQFIESNFVPNTFTSSKNNFYIYFDNNGELYYGKAFDLVKKQFIDIPTQLLNTVKPLTINIQITDKHSGIIKTPEGYVAISILPVLTADGKRPIYGSMLMGYYIGKSTFDDISKTVEMNVSMIPLSFIKNDALIKSVYQELSTSASEYIIPKSPKTMYGFTFIKDIFDKPIAILKVEIPREMYSEGLITISHYLGFIIGLGILILITVWLLLKKIVLDRILSISNQVIKINSEANFFKRISISGNDEMNKMTSSLNSMLELIEIIQEQLKYRISRRTKELEKISHLNRNLFVAINKHRSTETKMQEDEKILRQLAYYDPLTGLPKGVFLDEILAKAILRAEINQSKIAVLFLDIDKFKKINDTYGHDFADKLLKQVAVQLKSAIKDTDMVARIGGDEFIIFLDNITGKEMIDKNVSDIFNALGNITCVDKINIIPFFSMGISIFPDDGKTVEELRNQADLAMYYAKKREGNIYYYYGAIMNKKSFLSPY